MVTATRPATRPLLTAQRLVAAAVATTLIPMSLRATIDPDLWWHLPTGDLVLSSGWPRHDVFSYTVAGREWITHEWLSQVVMELVHRAGGFAGLMVFFGLVALATSAIVYATGRMVGAGPLLAAVATFAVARTSIVAWGARPQLFNVLLAAATVGLLEGVRRGRFGSSRLVLLVPLALVWANLHSGFYVGVAITATYAVGDLIDARFEAAGPRLDVATARRLLTITAAMLVVAVVNPSGPHLWVYPFETLGSDAQRELIAEWRPPDLGDPTYWPFAAMLAVGVVALATSRTRVTVTDLGLFLGTAAAGLTSLRHISLFAVIAAPVIVRHVLSATDGTPLGAVASGRRDQPLRSGGLAVVLVAVLVATATVTSARKISGNGEVIVDELPVAAVDAALAADLDDGRVFNTYGYGGYLVWRDVDVFIDGRADVYGAPMLRAHDEVSSAREDWAAILERFGVTWTLLHPDVAAVRLLDLSDEWERVYADDTAVVHRRTR